MVVHQLHLENDDKFKDLREVNNIITATTSSYTLSYGTLRQPKSLNDIISSIK